MKILAPGDIIRTRIGGRVPAGSRGTVTLAGADIVEATMDCGRVLYARDQVAKSFDQSPLLPPMRFRLPYGVWTCADGLEVLFNRNYRPILTRGPGRPAWFANGTEFVPFSLQEWFYGDHNPPWRDRRTHDRCRSVLADWGFAHWNGEGLPPEATLNSLAHVERAA